MCFVRSTNQEAVATPPARAQALIRGESGSDKEGESGEQAGRGEIPSERPVREDVEGR